MSSPKGMLNVVGPYEITEVRVVDDNLREVASGTHEIKVELEPGIYQVEARIPGDVAQKLVAVEAGSTVSVDDLVLRYDSATPVPEAESSRRYQIGPASALSKQTHKSCGIDPKARLFLFARTKGKADKRNEKPSFTLKDRDGKTMARFPDSGDVHLSDGWLALSVSLPAGVYAVEQEVPGLGKRGQALFVEDGWQTQVFAPWQEVPDFGFASIYIRPAVQGFEPQTFWEYERTEAAILGLAHGKLVLHPGEVEDFLLGKFDNPMLGLIGTYALLDQDTIDYERLKIIANNLLSLLPHNPDAKLISLLADLKGQWPPPVPKDGWPGFEDPPLFAAGTARLIRLASAVEELCPANSWLARISPLLTGGSAWTRWESGVTTSKVVARVQTELRDVVERHVDFFIGKTRFTPVRKSFIDKLLKAILKGSAPIVPKILKGFGIKPAELFAQTLKDIARELAPRVDLPLSVVQQVMKDLMEGASLKDAVVRPDATRGVKKAKAPARRKAKRGSPKNQARSATKKTAARKKSAAAKKASAKKRAYAAPRARKTAAKAPSRRGSSKAMTAKKAYKSAKKQRPRRATARRK